MDQTLLDRIGGGLDRRMRGIPRFFLRKSRLSQREYVEALAFYQPDRWPPERKSFLRVPRTTPPFKVEEEKALAGDRVFRIIRYPSRYEPANPALREKFFQYPANLNAYLIHWKHAGELPRRPLVLCIHGFQMARPRRAERMFRIRRLLELGLDVALYVQPFHWRRAAGTRHNYFSPYHLPFFIETTGQNIHDLHAGVLLLRTLGYERIGLIGASLGGSTAALYSATGPEVEFVFLVVPAINPSEFQEAIPGRFRFPLDGEAKSAAEGALRLVNPLENRPRIDPQRIKVVLHTGDGFCPAEHTREWARRWSIPNLVEVPGGHWLYFDRQARGQAWYGWLREMKFVE